MRTRIRLAVKHPESSALAAERVAMPNRDTKRDHDPEGADDHCHDPELRQAGCGPDHRVTALRRLGVGMVEHPQRPLAFGNLDRERIAGLVVVDGYEHASIALASQQPHVEIVVDTAVQLAHRGQEPRGYVVTLGSGWLELYCLSELTFGHQQAALPRTGNLHRLTWFPATLSSTDVQAFAV